MFVVFFLILKVFFDGNFIKSVTEKDNKNDTHRVNCLFWKKINRIKSKIRDYYTCDIQDSLHNSVSIDGTKPKIDHKGSKGVTLGGLEGPLRIFY